MAFHQTPFDHIGVWSPPQRLLPFLQGTCFVLIEASRFAVSSLLIVLGLPLFAFLFLAGWDLGLLFTQLANLADHYREADAIRRIAFSQDLQGVFLATSLGVLLARAPRFLKRLEMALAPPASQETDNGETDNG